MNEYIQNKLIILEKTNLDLLVKQKEVDLFAEAEFIVILVVKWEIILW